MSEWMQDFLIMGGVANVGLLFIGAVVSLLVAMNPATTHCRPAAWLLFASTTGVFVMNALQLGMALASQVLASVLGVQGYWLVFRALPIIEWPIMVLIGIALFRFRSGISDMGESVTDG